MDNFAANTAITVVIPLVYNGTNLTVSSFSYGIKDSSGAVVLAMAPYVGSIVGNSISLPIAATHNVITSKYDIREIFYEMTTTQGVYPASLFYKLSGNILQLTVMVDSFMTFGESLLVQESVTSDITDYNTLTDQLKVAALEYAYKNLITKRFYVGGILIENLEDYTEAQFNALDPKFKKAIKLAQLLEAADIVEDNPILDKINSGIVSETIGESSMFFNQSFSSYSKVAGVSKPAYDVLKDYLYKDATSSQIWTIRRA